MKTTGYIYLGTTIKGDWSRPIPLRSLEEFKQQFGSHSPEGSITYEYVGGILSAGLPVLFQRIACENQASVSWSHNIPDISSTAKRANCATCAITHKPSETAASIIDCVITEKWGGTYGNGMSISIQEKNNTIIITVKYGATILERADLITFNGEESAYDKKLAVIEAINSIELETINMNAPVAIDEKTGKYDEEAVNAFEIPLTGKITIDTSTNTSTSTDTGTSTNTDTSTSTNTSTAVSDTISGTEVETTVKMQDKYVPLTGGTDFNEALVPAEIPKLMYPEANGVKPLIMDKILYSPKFITSGGYTDNLPTSTKIGDAMENLAEARQDCRALIDLPLGTKLAKQQEYAGKYQYKQLASNSIITSASICAPWLYMQVGSTYMWTPPSFAFLSLIGGSVSTGGKTYTPKAGLATGRVVGVIKPEFDIGADIAEAWQKDGNTNINPIMRLQSGNYVIAGNSTLLTIDEGEINAFNESSADLAIIEIRRFVYNLATELQYQYNSSTAFETFSMKTSKMLNTMITDGAVTDYAIVNISTNDDPRTLKIKLNVWVTPTIKAIEIYLNVAYGNVTMETGGEA